MFEFRFLPALAAPPTPWAPGGKCSAQFAGREPKDTANLRAARKLSLSNWMDPKFKGTEAYWVDTLVSYYYFRDLGLTLDPDAYVLGDSGGFSLVRYGKSRPDGPPHARRLDARDIIRWQASVCTAGLILDMPPEELDGTNIYEKALHETTEFTRSALATYKKLQADGSAFKWWGVVHGWGHNHWNTWYDTIRQVYPFDEPGEGWSMRIRPVAWDAVGIARALRWLDRHSISRTHILMATSPGAMTTILVLGAQTGLEFITCDSTSAATVAFNRSVWRRNPGKPFALEVIPEKGDERQARDFLLNDCDCLSCTELHTEVAERPELIKPYSQYWKHRFSFHNHIQQFALVRALQTAATTDGEALLREVLGKKATKVWEAFQPGMLDLL